MRQRTGACAQRLCGVVASRQRRRRPRTTQAFRTYLGQTVLPAVRSAHGDAMLAEFVRRWGHHKIMNKWMWRVFQYLVRGGRFRA